MVAFLSRNSVNRMGLGVQLFVHRVVFVCLGSNELHRV